MNSNVFKFALAFASVMILLSANAATGIQPPLTPEPPRATFVPYPDMETALSEATIERPFGNSPLYMTLNGEWQYVHAETQSGFPEDLHETGIDSVNWQNITVPSCFAGDEQHSRIIYSRSFTLPDSWKKHRVFINFTGITPPFSFQVNGHNAGQAPAASAEFEITEHIKENKNIITIDINAHSPDSPGIFGEVYLFATRDVRLRDFFIWADIQDDLKSADFTATAKVRNLSGGTLKKCSIEITILDEQNQPLGGKPVMSLNFSDIAPDRDNISQGRKTVSGFKLWSPDKPNLYTVLLHLKDASGSTIECTTCRFGFRKFEARNGSLYLNNSRLYLRGVNRPEKCATGFETMLKDISLFKQHNINATRTAGTTHDTRWHDLCDKYGVIVINEANIATDSQVDPITLTDTCIDRVNRLIQRDKNRTCVMAWTPALERVDDDLFRAVAEHTQLTDPTRLLFSSDNWQDFPSLVSFASAPGNDLQAMLKHANSSDQRPFFFRELNINAEPGLQAMWDAIYAHPKCNGSFIQNWVYDSSSGGLVMPDRTPLPVLYETARIYQPVEIRPGNLSAGQIGIRNHFTDTNISELDVVWTLLENGHPTQIAKIEGLNISPQSFGFVEMPHMDKPFRFGGERWARIEFKTREASRLLPADHVVAFEVFRLPSPNSPPPAIFDPSFEPPLIQRSDNRNIILRSGKRTVMFDKVLGNLSAIRYFDEDIISHPPDRAGGLELNLADLLPAANQSLKTKLVSFTSEQISSNKFKVVSHLQHVIGKSGLDQITAYTVYGAGIVRVDVSIRPIGAPLASEIENTGMGMTMPLSSALQNISWYGHGPYENYPHRKAATTVGLYKQSVTNLFIPYPDNSATGNREGIRWMAFTSKFQRGMLLSFLYNPGSVTVFPFTPRDMKHASTGYGLTTTKNTFLTVNLLRPEQGKRLVIDKNINFTFFIHAYDSILQLADSLWYINMPAEQHHFPEPPKELPFISIKDVRDRPITITASSQVPENPVSLALDSDTSTFWQNQKQKQKRRPEWISVDFKDPVHMDGIRIHWKEQEEMLAYKVEASSDGRRFITVANRTTNSSPVSVVNHYFSRSVKNLKITITDGTQNHKLSEIDFLRRIPGEGTKTYEPF